jgi:hypothetical protein
MPQALTEAEVTRPESPETSGMIFIPGGKEA